jgi:hypothetical protein
MAETEALSTGMGNLDNKFERGGLHPGSVVVVRTPPSALGQVVLYNLAAGRPTTYVPVGPCDEATKATLREAGKLGPAALTVEGLPSADPAGALGALLDGLELPPGGTLLVEPVNLLESAATASRYATLLSMLADRARAAGGLAGLLAIDADTTPDNRWLTLHEADTVTTVLHEVSTRTVHDHLALEKLHPRQELQDPDDRVFRLPRSLEIDIDTKKNLSP